MRHFLSFCLLGLVVFSCGTFSKESTNTGGESIRYEMKVFRVESSGGCDGDTTACAYYQVNFPVFAGIDSAIVKGLTLRIDSAVSMGNPELMGKPMRAIGENFVKSYDDFTKEIPDTGGGWFYRADVTVNVLTDTLISLSVGEQYYTGGAHGGSGVYFIAVNPRTGNDFTLRDFLKPGYEAALTEAGEKAFRRARQMSDTVSFKNNSFEFPNDKFQLNQNYGFQKDGLVFYYNSYEIAPYAAGPTEVFIPYAEIKDLLKK